MIGLALGVVLALAAVVYVVRPLLAAPVLPDEDGVEAAAETLIGRYRQAAVATTPTCARCGPRPEPDAAYCSSCGARLGA
jgi:hypothetical protein